MSVPPEGQPSSLAAVYVSDGQKKTSSNETYGSNQSNIDTILVKNKGTFHMRGGTLTKTGDTTSEEKSAVSYTHLDVYKRQVWNCRSLRNFTFFNSERTFSRIAASSLFFGKSFDT